MILNPLANGVSRGMKAKICQALLLKAVWSLCCKPAAERGDQNALCIIIL